MVARNHWLIRLIHEATGREVPVELTTVFGRNAKFYRYQEGKDPRADRLEHSVEALAAHDYVQIMHDDRVSRTHGLLDPTVPGLADLNSSNGTLLNGVPLPRVHGGPGPVRSLHHGDLINVGQQRFHVLLRATNLDSMCGRAARTRVGLIGCDARTRLRGEQLAQFLKERKRFSTSVATDLSSYVASAFALKRLASDEGVNVFALCCRAEGTTLTLANDTFELAELLRFLGGVPGRKVLALELEGDPTAVEREFLDRASSDMALLTSPGEATIDEPLEHSIRSLPAHALRDSVGGRGSAGAFDDLVDGLDAMISPETNRLDVSWTQGYAGRLKVVFGGRDVGGETSVAHSLRFGSTTYRFWEG